MFILLFAVAEERGEVLGFISFGTAGNDLWLYDNMKNSILLFPLDSILANQQYRTDQEYTLQNRYYYAGYVDTNQIVANGDYESDYMLAFVDVKSGATTRKILPYAADPTGVSSSFDKIAHESLFFLKPSGEKGVLAHRYADRVDVVDLKTEKVTVITGPEGFSPELTKMETPDGYAMASRNTQTRFAFLSGKSTNKYIYLLYSGYHEDTEHKYNGSFIYVYDWEGKPVKKILLQEDIMDFAVTSDDKKIYTHDPKAYSIKVANIP